jgi:hypothetical protein
MPAGTRAGELPARVFAGATARGLRQIPNDHPGSTLPSNALLLRRGALRNWNASSVPSGIPLRDGTDLRQQNASGSRRPCDRRPGLPENNCSGESNL